LREPQVRLLKRLIEHSECGGAHEGARSQCNLGEIVAAICRSALI
jgi:hypothetical protein